MSRKQSVHSRNVSHVEAKETEQQDDYEKDGFVELESTESKEKKKKGKKKNNRYQAYCWACEIGQKCLRHQDIKLKPSVTDQAVQQRVKRTKLKKTNTITSTADNVNGILESLETSKAK